MGNYFEEFENELKSITDAISALSRCDCGGLDCGGLECSNCPLGHVYGVVHPIMIKPPNEDNVQYETMCMVAWFTEWYKWNMKHLHNKYDLKEGDPDGTKES